MFVKEGIKRHDQSRSIPKGQTIINANQKEMRQEQMGVQGQEEWNLSRTTCCLWIQPNPGCGFSGTLRTRRERYLVPHHDRNNDDDGIESQDR